MNKREELNELKDEKKKKKDLQTAAFHLERLLMTIPRRSRAFLRLLSSAALFFLYFFAPLRSLLSNYNPAPHFKRKKSTNASQREVAVAAFRSITSREDGKKAHVDGEQTGVQGLSFG